MTKEHRAELGRLKKQLKAEDRTLATVKTNVDRAFAKLTKQYRRDEKRLRQAFSKAEKTFTRDERVASRSHAKQTEQLRQRVSILEGRLS